MALPFFVFPVHVFVDPLRNIACSESLVGTGSNGSGDRRVRMHGPW